MGTRKRLTYMDRTALMSLVAQIVDRRGGPTAVARELGITQPAVTQAVRDENSRNDSARLKILYLDGYEATAIWKIRRVK